ncbi:MAG: hypothetical protein HY049_16690 [Acidobacteria bacterium]|nr:hypothetical protein [Acidobacteriota bacterium]
MQVAEGTEIIGHRGAGGHAPDNTESAILAGIRLGATAVEVDVQFTADGLAVVFHDRTLERMAGVRGRIREQTARELAGYDIGFRFGEDHRGLRILTLDECARIVPREMYLHVEIKDYDPVTPAHLKDVVGSLRRRNALDRTVFSSFNDKILVSLRGIDPSLLLGLLVAGRAMGSVSRAAELGCFSLNPEAAQVDAALIEACHAKDLKVYPYTANDPGLMKQLIALGVDGIYTDFPGRLAELVGHAPRPRHVAPRPQGRAASGPESPREPRRGRRGASPPDRAAAHPRAEATGAPQRDAVEPDDVIEIAPAPEGAAAEGLLTDLPGPDGAPRRKRRRGRRGGRRHKRKANGAAAGEAESPDAGDAAAPPDSADSPGSDAALDAGDAVGHARGDADDSAFAEPFEEGSTTPLEAAGAPAISTADQASPAGDQKPRRRRGRRGGRRHRRGGSAPKAGDGSA